MKSHELKTQINEKRALVSEKRSELETLATLLETRDFNPEEQEKFDALTAEVSGYKETISSLESRIAKIESVEPADEAPAEDAPRSNVPAVMTRSRIGIDNRGNSDAQEIESYRSYLSTGIQTRATVPVSIGSANASGGYAIAPFSVYSKILAGLANQNIVRRLATVLKTDSAFAFRVPKMNTLWANPELVAEGTCQDPDAGAFGTIDLTPQGYSKIVTVAESMVQLGGSLVENFVSDMLVRQFGEVEETAFTVGTGVGTLPRGIFVASNDGIPTSRDVNAGTTGVISYDDIVNLVYSIKDSYRRSPSFAFICHRTIAAMIRKLKDSTGQPLWEASLALGQPDTLLGYPLYTSESAPSAITAGSYVLAAGDVSTYFVVDRSDLRVQRLVERYIDCGLIGYRAVRYFSGSPTDAMAFSRLKMV